MKDKKKSKHKYNINTNTNIATCLQTQAFRGVLRKMCSENMQQIYRRKSVPKSDFNKVAMEFFEITLQHKCSPVSLLYIFRAPFPKNTSGGVLLSLLIKIDYGHEKKMKE